MREEPWDWSNISRSLAPGSVGIWERFGKCFHTPPIFVVIQRSICLAASSCHGHPLKENARINMHLGCKGCQIRTFSKCYITFGKMESFGISAWRSWISALLRISALPCSTFWNKAGHLSSLRRTWRAKGRWWETYHLESGVTSCNRVRRQPSFPSTGPGGSVGPGTASLSKGAVSWLTENTLYMLLPSLWFLTLTTHINMLWETQRNWFIGFRNHAFDV